MTLLDHIWSLIVGLPADFFILLSLGIGIVAHGALTKIGGKLVGGDEKGAVSFKTRTATYIFAPRIEILNGVKVDSLTLLVVVIFFFLYLLLK